ncbi:hypothetical protein KIL84_013475 [Mauremys mutica]|uniref:Uncharacterized protein n=1 Tax=Mauremys mutica TaxID=74926 RepID=A0A9D4AUD3_9SAUR|nr:hypothetical protein KIL84_013475 [Mauremys mutica]
MLREGQSACPNPEMEIKHFHCCSSHIKMIPIMYSEVRNSNRLQSTSGLVNLKIKSKEKKNSTQVVTSHLKLHVNCMVSLWKKDASSYSSQATSNKELENLKLQSFLGPGLEQLQRASVPLGQLILKDLFSLYDYNEYVPMSDDFSEYVRQVEDAAWKNRGGTGIANPMRSNSFPWAKYPRRKRDFSMGVAGVCCKWGCTKAEISTLC